MGKHHESGQVVDLVISRTFGRVLSVCFLAVLMIFAFGFQGPRLGGQSADGSLATGQVEPGMLPDGATSGVQGTTPQRPSSASVPAGVTARLSFERSPVQTLDKNGVGNLNVASSSLDRPAAGKLYAPLEVLVPSSPFGLRIDPFTGLPGEFHWGQDFAAACGTLVYAADSGVVRAVGWHPWGGGNRVEIDHGNGLVTTYNHLQGIAVEKGQSVRVGEVIARVGTTGSSTGCHLHFETIVNGVYTNPMNWTFQPTKQVDALGDIPMVSYQPGSATATSAGSVWSIPGAVPTEQAVTGGVQEAKVAPPSPSSTAAATPTASPTASPTRTPTPSPTATPSPTGTGAPKITPSPTATPTPSPTRTTTPSPPQTQGTTNPPSTTPKPSTTPAPIKTQSSTPSQAPSQAPVVTQAPVVAPTPTATVPPAVAPSSVTVPPTVAPSSTPPAPAPAPPAPASPAPSATSKPATPVTKP